MKIGTLASGKSFSLPVNATTQAIAIIGRRGSGKSYFATKLAELMHGQGQQFIAIDPVGIWWGLRLAADGKGKGLDIVIFGGLHGDIPLQPSAGALIADVIVDRGISAVIDISQFEADTDKARFARDFAVRFYFRKSQLASPVHVFIEEAQEIIPQNIQRGEEQMLHVWQRMIRLGRNHGIGVSMISQRPQDVNKKALNQAECVFAFQLTGPQERKAVRDWILDKGLDESLAETLPKLVQGHAHVWSPVWLEINEEVTIGKKQTFAAGSTPVSGSKPIVTKPLSEGELAKLRDSMAATIEQAKANDPKELKAKIVRLEKELAVKDKGKTITAPDPAATDRLVNRAVAERDKYWQGELAKFRKYDATNRAAMSKASKLMADALAYEVPTIEAPKVTDRPRAVHIDGPRERPVSQLSPRPVVSRVNTEDGVSGVEQRVLSAVAELRAVGIENAPRIQVAFLAGYSHLASTGFVKAMSSLRTKGLIDYPSPGTMGLTDTGVESISMPEVPLTSEQLQERIYSLVGPTCERMLKVLIASYPDPIERQSLAEQTGYNHLASTGFVKALSKLRSLGFVTYPSSKHCQAASILFVE